MWRFAGLFGLNRMTVLADTAEKRPANGPRQTR
jgi:hypothetical protein